MLAITLKPGIANSAQVTEVPPPDIADGPVLVRTLALGVCGTDRDILGGLYGSAPSGAEKLILGHESLGAVVEAPSGCGFAPGDRIVGIVRRPDPLPCPACAVGEWDMCSTELYTERGIKGRHGYGAELFRIEPTFAVRIPDALGHLGVLVEPASIVAKAWDHIGRIGARSRSCRPRTLLVTGAGPIGLLAALFGAQRQLDLHVFDRTPGGLKRDLVHALGGTYHSGSLTDLEVSADIIIECTGAVPVMVEMVAHSAANAIMCLLGLPHGASERTYDVAALGRTMVLRNQVLVGTVNANRSHYEAAVAALAKAPRDWLARLITRRVPLSQWQDAVEHRFGDIKNLVIFAGDREGPPASRS